MVGRVICVSFSRSVQKGQSLSVVNALFPLVVAKYKMQKNDLIEPEEGGSQREAN